MTTEREATIAELSTAFAPEDFGISTDRGASALARLVVVKEQLKALTAEKDAIEQALKVELTNNPDPIVDGEHHIVAVLKERSKPASIDLVTMATIPQAQAHIVEAARAGVLSAALTPLRALKGTSAWADALLHMEIPGGVNFVLEVSETK